MSLIVEHWYFGTIGWLLLVVLAVHQVGYVRRQRVVSDRSKRSYRDRRWRMFSFVAAIAVLIVAFESPIDYYSASLFWVHMIQHLLLIVVAAPLVAVSAPWLVLLRGLPIGVRRYTSRVALHASWTGPLRSLGRSANRPVVGWVALVASVWLWHTPPLYDATLRSTSIHYLEHGLFFFCALLFWVQVIDSYPLRCRLSYAGRVGYLVAFALQNWILGMSLAFASGPWYSGYANLASRPGGLSALEDQQIGGGIMWIPGMIPVAITVAALASRFVALRPGDDGTGAVLNLDDEFTALVASSSGRTSAADRAVPARWRLQLAPRHRRW